MILRCWRAPRSAGRTDIRCPNAVRPTARFSGATRSAIEAAARIANSTVDVVAGAGLDPPIEVEEDPDVGGLLEVELLDLDLAVAGGRLPVDPVHAVARGVRPDGRRQRRRLERPFRCRVAALEVGRRQPPQRERLDPRVDDEGDRLADGRRCLEEAERVAGPDLERLDPEVAAPGERHLGDPAPLAAGTERDRPARDRHRQGGRVVDLEPRLRDAARRCAGCRSPGAARRRGRGAGRPRSRPRDRTGRGGSGRSSRRRPGSPGRAGRTGTAARSRRPPRRGRRRGRGTRSGGPSSASTSAADQRREPRSATASDELGRDRPRTADRRPDRLDRERLEQLADDLAGLDVVDRRAGLDDQPVGERRLGQQS